jgi:hypothetical protein
VSSGRETGCSHAHRRPIDHPWMGGVINWGDFQDSISRG